MGRNLVIYLDTCIYGRPFDRPQPPEMRAEVKAIDAILKKRERGEFQIIGSTVTSFEIGQITNATERKTIDAYYCKFITEDIAPPAAQVYTRADILAATGGLGALDSQHLAIAEDIGADFLLTVDKDFIKKCNLLNLTTVKVMNPLDFVKGGNLK
jgi:predicted nucleic acid-binding protein